MANYARQLQPELAVNHCKIITVSADNYLNTLEHRHSVGAFWPFLCDYERKVISELEIIDLTDKRYSPVAIPYTFVLDGNREIYKIYNGWWYLGRPRVEELRQDLRALTARRPDWPHQASTGEAITGPPLSLQPGQTFPDFTLPNQDGEQVQLSQHVGGWPTALIFIRGQKCPEDWRQLTSYVHDLQPDMRSGYFNLVTVSVESESLIADLRRGLDAQWTFLSDADRALIQALGIVDNTNEDHASVAIPFTFILDGSLEIYKAYFGEWFVGRPTVEELRQDFRALMARRADWAYDDNWNYGAIHSAKRYQLTHGMMDTFHPPQGSAKETPDS